MALYVALMSVRLDSRLHVVIQKLPKQADVLVDTDM